MKRLLRPALCILALVMAVWFLLPVFFGIVDLSNVCGVLFFGLLALAAAYWPRLRALLKRLWKRRGMRVLLGIAGGLLAGLVLLTLVLTGFVFSGMAQPPADAELVIVLGCQVNGEQPSLLLDHRIETAADYLRVHPSAVCIVSGGQGSNEAIPEAECMRRGLIARGIDEARILTEARSSTTAENLDFSMALMRENGLHGPVVLVSNNFHLYRALQMAKARGLEASGLAAECDWYMLPTYVLREAMALVKFRLFS